MNFATECLTSVSAIDAAISPFLLQKSMEVSKLHKVINARLQFWCEQFPKVPVPAFDGIRGFGFDGRFKTEILPDEHLVRVEVVGQNVVAAFQAGVDATSDFEITFPSRYLDDKSGGSSILADAEITLVNILARRENGAS